MTETTPDSLAGSGFCTIRISEIAGLMTAHGQHHPPSVTPAGAPGGERSKTPQNFSKQACAY